MLPRFSKFDAAYQFVRNFELIGYGYLAHRSNHLPDSKHIGLFKLCVERLFSFYIPSLCNAVTNIFKARSDKMMGRIYAAGIVSSGAVVAKLHSFWNWTNEKLPNNSVRHSLSGLIFAHAVTSTGASSSPQPARSRFVDFSPDACGEGIPSIHTKPGTKVSNAFWRVSKNLGTLLANRFNLGRFYVSHNEYLSLCLGSSGRLTSFRTAATLQAIMIWRKTNLWLTHKL